MPERPVAATNPLSFMTNDGNHLMIPISALYFDSGGALKADRWPLYTANQAAVDPFLAGLRASGALKPGPEPPAKPAMKVTAVTKGATGVVIEIEIANVTANPTTPASSTADVKITETNTFTALPLTALIATLGSTAANGTRPGLVFASSAGPAILPKAGVYQLAIGAPGQPAKVDVDKNTGTGAAFTLESRSNDAASALTKAEVKNVDATNNTFTLIVTWTKSVTATVMSALAAAFAYVVVIAPPDGGFRAPNPGKVSLVGGSDAVSASAVPQSATVLSSQ